MALVTGTAASVLIMSVTAAISLAAIVISVITFTGGFGGPGPVNTTILVTSLLLGNFLSLSDNSSQPIAGPNIWTPVRFNTNLFPGTNSTWLREGDTYFICNQSGLSTVQFTVQAQANTSSLAPIEIPMACTACSLKYQVRAVLQPNGTDLVNEIPGSLAYQNGASNWLSSAFIVNASRGDVLSLQFGSMCGQVVLYPYPYIGNNLPQSDSFPTSATLLITA